MGTVNPSYLIAKIKGFDIRKKGSGNAGASNALMIMGKTFGVFCALFDIAKAFFAVFLCERLFPGFFHALAVAGTACIIGHIFPFYMKFKGGKGLACLGGAALYFDWRIFLALLAAEIVIVLVTDYICFVPTTASVAFLIIYGFIKKDVAGALIFAVAAAVIVIKHVENFKRIKAGTEVRFSYLWRPEDEIERISSAEDKSEDEIKEHFYET